MDGWDQEALWGLKQTWYLALFPENYCLQPKLLPGIASQASLLV
jgi:hypothetical protein